MKELLIFCECLKRVVSRQLTEKMCAFVQFRGFCNDSIFQ